MHSASVHSELGAHGTSAEEHHASTAPNAREGTFPSRRLPGALDHQVGPETAINLTDDFICLSQADIDDTISAQFAGPLQPLRPTSGDHNFAYSESPKRQHLQQSERPCTDYQYFFKLLRRC